MKKITLYLFWICLINNYLAQNNYKIKTLVAASDTTFLDSLTVIPNQISIKHNGNKNVSNIRFDVKTNSIIRQSNKIDTLNISYKTFPYNFNFKHQHKSPDLQVRALIQNKNPFSLIISNNQLTNSSPLFTDGLNKNGSISRGISFGNNQDVSLQSNLNLQINGELTKDVQLILAASDENIPFQTGGTTAQLEEFDKVFAQINTQSSKLIIGDYQLEKPNSYFMSFYKRAQGALISNEYKDTIKKIPVTFNTQLAGAVSKGKFSRNVFQGIENNQGAYKLLGNENEMFIVVLTGTERVYIDGRQLQRGQDHDYIIDYNAAEITFTAKQPITKDKRIVVEFQYSDKNYARYLWHLQEEIKSKNSKIILNYFNEFDDKNVPFQQVLNNDQKQLLYQIGDTINKAIIPSAQAVIYSNAENVYLKKDSIVNGKLYKSVYISNKNSLLQSYRLKFSFVGNKKGNYILSGTNLYGKLYKWVAPINDIQQGDYEPIITLITPKDKQLLTTSYIYSFNLTHQFEIETALSNNDINTFSPYQKTNDFGKGIKLKYENKIKLNKADSIIKQKSFLYNVNYEYIDQSFTWIERYRQVEFNREWSRSNGIETQGNQHVLSGNVGYEHGTFFKTNYSLNSFIEQGVYVGLLNKWSTQIQNNKNILKYNASFLSSNSNTNTNQYFRHKSSFTKEVNQFKFHFLDEFENNLSNQNVITQIQNNRLWDWEVSLSNKDTISALYKLFYKQRKDDKIKNNNYLDSTQAKTIGFQVKSNQFKNHSFSIYFSYRELEVNKQNVSSMQNSSNVLGRVEYSPILFNSLIKSNLFYETVNGVDFKRDVYFLKVAPGQGLYAWKDYNNNGIQELNEFEVAFYNDQAQYNKLFVATNQSVKTINNQFNVSLNVIPAVLFKQSKNKFKNSLSRFSYQLLYKNDNKYLESKATIQTFNPLFFNINDSALVAVNNMLRNTLFFNTSGSLFSFDYSVIQNVSKQFVTTGYEIKELKSQDCKLRYNITKQWSLNYNLIEGLKTQNLSNQMAKNYFIRFYELEQKLIYQPSTETKIAINAKYQNKNNSSKQQANIVDVGFDMKLNKVQSGTLVGKINYINIQYNDVENSYIAYEMLNDLKIGSNFVWNFTFQKTVGKNLQITFNYEGRKPHNLDVTHIGSAQIKAFF